MASSSSWIKTSAQAGLSGLTPREAAREALFNPNLQSLPDPLDEPIVKELNVSNRLYINNFICCIHVEKVEIVEYNL